jgi:hypothetical protein
VASTTEKIEKTEHVNSAASTTGAVVDDAWREVTIREGTTLGVILDTPVGSDTSRVEDPVTAHLSQPIVVEDVEALAEGSTLYGVVTEATRAGKVKGRAQLALRFDEIAPRGSDVRYDVNTGTFRRIAPSEKKKDAMKLGIPAAGGAVVGGIVGGKKGAVIGGAVGAGAGAAVVVTDRGKEVRLGQGAALTLRLAEPITVRVKIMPKPR